MWTAKWPGMPI